MKRNCILLKTSIAAALLGAAISSPAASAASIDFEDVELITVDGGQSIISRNYRFTAANSPLAQFYGATGAAGGVYNGGQGCGDTPCPAGNASNFYVGLNDGSVTIVNNEMPHFRIHGLDFGFLAPLPNLADGIYGQLRLTGNLAGGGSIMAAMDFAGQNADGGFMFTNWILDQSFSTAFLNSLTISACRYDGSGACVNSVDEPALNLAQFAIDNLAVSVPEPAAPALLMLGALGMALSARRRAK
jgi:hypothetical protein